MSDPQSNGNTWISAPKLFEDTQDEEKVKQMYASCWGHFCNILCEGVFVPCTIALYMYRNIDLSDKIKEEIINVREEIPTNKLTEKFINFYSQPYSNYCHYCHMDNLEYNLPCGEQLV